MTFSMTAFSRTQSQVGKKILCWEIKSVNHRYLEASFRLPEVFKFLETNLREQLRSHLNRGKIDCNLKISDHSDETQSLQVNHELITTLISAASAIALRHDSANDLTVSRILTWPGVISTAEADVEHIGKDVQQSFQQAIEQLLSARQIEGQALEKNIQIRLQRLQEEVHLVKKEIGVLQQQQKEKLQNKLDNLQLNVEKNRIEQELALILTRLDVSEELDRLETHIDEVKRALQSQEPVGRRLDFLMQELNREANTLSSKSDSAFLTQHTVEMKVLIEQMREQIQNIE